LEILMFLVGIALLLLEIFIIPGFGIAGISGIVLILSSLVFSLQDFYWPQFDWQWTIARRNVGVVGGGVIGGLILIAVIMASMPRISLFNRLILKQPGDPDYAGENSRRQAGKDRKERKNRRESGPAVDSSTKDTPVEPSYVGMEGTAVTDLRPVGKIRIGVNTVVAETDGEYYDKGTQVVVLRSDGVKVVVAAKEDS
jgi:membrane-bound serine protease (ClpP class)